MFFEESALIGIPFYFWVRAGMMSEEEQLLLSLRTAVLDKLNKEYREVSDNLSCEIQSLQSTEADLLLRGTKIETIHAQMISELVS